MSLFKQIVSGGHPTSNGVNILWFTSANHGVGWHCATPSIGTTPTQLNRTENLSAQARFVQGLGDGLSPRTIRRFD